MWEKEATLYYDYLDAQDKGNQFWEDEESRLKSLSLSDLEGEYDKMLDIIMSFREPTSEEEEREEIFYNHFLALITGLITASLQG